MTTKVSIATTPTLLEAVAEVDLVWAVAPDTAPLQPSVESISATLDPRVPQTLARLDGSGRQLLALRSYLRSGPRLPERCSLTQTQIDSFEESPEQRDLQREVGRIRTAFGAPNRGFESYINSQVRSLDVQIAHWIRNESVKAAADETLAAAQALIASPEFPANRPVQARPALATFLS